jgi:glycerophosphoryl diester phosphodiesterase
MCQIVHFSHLALAVVCATCILSTAPAKALTTQIIGHRGASEDAPENTVASFKLGYAQGADGCELDFHSTKDHRLIVIHDGTTKRVAGVDKKVSEQTFDELRALIEQVAATGNLAESSCLSRLNKIVPFGRRAA